MTAMTGKDGKDKAQGMKSAYELALERLEAQGIERPREHAFSDETKHAIAEARRVTESKLAELEILHRDKLAKLGDPVKRAEQEEYYQLEKERISADGEARVAKLRG
ncbi:MAG: hypothetical protein AMXMBFR36_25270 [Acidobacteriota bacterium]